MAENVKRKAKTKAKAAAGKKRTGKKPDTDLPDAPDVAPKGVLVKLMRRALATEEATASARGELGQEMAEAVARHNVHPAAFKMARKLSKMTDLARAETIWQLEQYIDLLGLRQDDLFRNNSKGKRKKGEDEALPDFTEGERNRVEAMPGEIGPMVPDGALANGGDAINA